MKVTELEHPWMALVDFTIHSMNEDTPQNFCLRRAKDLCSTDMAVWGGGGCEKLNVSIQESMHRINVFTVF